MVSDDLLKVVYMGDVFLMSNNETILVLKDVKHALDIQRNLISTGKLNDEGNVCTFGDRQWNKECFLDEQ